LIVASLAACSLCSSVSAEEPTGAQPIDPDSVTSNFTFTAGGGYLYGFDGDFDNQGHVRSSRLDIGADVDWRFAEDWNISLKFNYVLDQYDFSSDNGLAPGEPWSDINQFDMGVILSYQFLNDWTIWGGAVLETSYETGADWNDSNTGGGLIGLTCTISKDLVLGGGLAIVTRLEDDIRFIPIVIINWNITDTLTLTSRTSGAFGGAAVEMVWHVDPWEFAVGGVHKYSRFRLDDDVIAPDGVGEEDSFPLYGRIGYNFSDNISLDFLGGATCFGKMELDDSNGDRINSEDFDAALFLGAYLKMRF